MAVYGYARVSSVDQDLEIQIAALRAAGCSIIRSEKRSGTSTQGREELKTLMEFLREGDELVITRIDRLARSVGDLERIVEELRERGVALRATEQQIDTSTASGQCFLEMLGVFAKFETALRRERQLEGIAKAKAAGKYLGRKPTAMAKAAEVRELADQGVAKSEIARLCTISRSSVYRALAQ